jgi:chromosomal replication initiation ATPase DnaA
MMRNPPSAALYRRLDKLSRERELTEVESEELERSMRHLGMIDDPLLKIKARVSEQFDVSRSLLESDLQHRWISHPRQVVMYLGHQVSKLSLSEIGRLMQRDHTTVLTGVRAVTARRAADRNLDQQIAGIEAKLS